MYDVRTLTEKKPKKAHPWPQQHHHQPNFAEIL